MYIFDLRHTCMYRAINDRDLSPRTLSLNYAFYTLGMFIESDADCVYVYTALTQSYRSRYPSLIDAPGVVSIIKTPRLN